MKDAMDFMRRNPSNIGTMSGTESMSALFRNYTAGGFSGRLAPPVVNTRYILAIQCMMMINFYHQRQLNIMKLFCSLYFMCIYEYAIHTLYIKLCLTVLSKKKRNQFISRQLVAIFYLRKHFVTKFLFSVHLNTINFSNISLYERCILFLISIVRFHVDAFEKKCI